MESQPEYPAYEALSSVFEHADMVGGQDISDDFVQTCLTVNTTDPSKYPDRLADAAEFVNEVQEFDDRVLISMLISEGHDIESTASTLNMRVGQVEQLADTYREGLLEMITNQGLDDCELFSLSDDALVSENEIIAELQLQET